MDARQRLPRPMGIKANGEVMDKVIKYDVEILDGKGIMGAAQKFTITELAVIERNARMFVVRDDIFTTIELFSTVKDGFRLYPILDNPSISIFCNDRTWGSGVWYKLYSSADYPLDHIKRDIRKAIKNKIGFFDTAIDLSIIKANGR